MVLESLDWELREKQAGHRLVLVSFVLLELAWDKKTDEGECAHDLWARMSFELPQIRRIQRAFVDIG